MQTQNDFLRQWLSRRRMHLELLFQQDALPPSTACIECQKIDGLFRCTDCFSLKLLCGPCLASTHQRLLFHRVEKWNGQHFECAALWQLGVKIHLGHGGSPCPERFQSPGWNAEAASGQPTHPSRKSNNTSGDNHSPSGGPGLFVPGAGTQPGHPHSSQNEDVDPAMLDEYAKARHELFSAGWDDDSFALDDDDEDEIIQQTSVDENSSIPVIHPRLIPYPPAMDEFNNPFLTVVHSNGIHHLPYAQCLCSKEASPRHVDDGPDLPFVALGFFPTSFKRISTVFTFHVLDDFRMHNLECKTSAWAYFQKLRRTTSPAFPGSVTNRYVELRRLSRMWRNLRLRQEHGFGHIATEPGAGQLAHFCPACPQPGINLPDNWKNDPDEYVHGLPLTSDGNYKSEHLRQVRPQDDVPLAPGHSFMTCPLRFLEYQREFDRQAPARKRLEVGSQFIICILKSAGRLVLILHASRNQWQNVTIITLHKMKANHYLAPMLPAMQ